MGVRLIALVALAAATLGACGGGGPAPAPAVVHGCEVSVESAWTAGGQSYRVTAATTGAVCGDAEAVLTVADAAGQVLLRDVFPTADVMTLLLAEEPAAMEAALRAWIDQPGYNLAASARLPAWGAGADTPMAGGYPFYPEAAFERDAYEALRGRNAPLFCYVQGLESIACHAFENGVFAKVGVQVIPG